MWCYFIGPATSTKGQKVRRHTHTSIPGPITTSGAHVVGINIPSSTHRGHTHSTPRRTSSLHEADRKPLSNHRANEGYVMNGGVVTGPQTQRKKARRSNSLNYHGNGRGSGVVLVRGNIDSTKAPNQSSLREAISLTQLPGGNHGGVTDHMQRGGMAGSRYPVTSHSEESGLNRTPLMTSSLKNIPSGTSQFNSNSTYLSHSNTSSERHRVRSHGQRSREILTSNSIDIKKVKLLIYTFCCVMQRYPAIQRVYHIGMILEPCGVIHNI